MQSRLSILVSGFACIFLCVACASPGSTARGSRRAVASGTEKTVTFTAGESLAIIELLGRHPTVAPVKDEKIAVGFIDCHEGFDFIQYACDFVDFLNPPPSNSGGVASMGGIGSFGGGGEPPGQRISGDDATDLGRHISAAKSRAYPGAQSIDVRVNQLTCLIKEKTCDIILQMNGGAI